MTRPGPFLRWAGGKRQLLPVLLAGMPHTFDRFFEPFVGGGALLFALADTVPGPRCTVNDVNADLVAAYRVVRDRTDELVARLRDLATDTSEQRYLAVRADHHLTDDVARAARLIYLNRTGFNGLYRVNSRGEYNVPWGKLANPEVCNETLLRADAARLAGADIRLGAFTDCVAAAAEGDFVYFDPPYIPLSPTASFSRYAKDDFREPDQRRLAACIAELTARGVKVMLSNSDTPLTREIFGPHLALRTVAVRRSVSAKASSRTRVHEVVGVNYPFDDMADAATFGAGTTPVDTPSAA